MLVFVASVIEHLLYAGSSTEQFTCIAHVASQQPHSLGTTECCPCFTEAEEGQAWDESTSRDEGWEVQCVATSIQQPLMGQLSESRPMK